MAISATLYLDIWSDYTSPFCYAEIPVIDQFRNAYGDAVEVRWHAFELYPDPVPLPDADSDALHTSWENAVFPLAEARGLTMRPPPLQPRSRQALEAARCAQAEGLFDAVHLAIFRAYFEDGLDIGDTDTLIDVCAACGIDPSLLEDALSDGVYAAAVDEDQALAQKLGVSGLPFVVLSRDPPIGEERAPAPIALRGAAPVQHFEAALERLFPDGFPEG